MLVSRLAKPVRKERGNLVNDNWNPTSVFFKSAWEDVNKMQIIIKNNCNTTEKTKAIELE